MTRKSSGGPYPPNWKEVADEVKAAAGWRCVRCGHPHDPETGHTLTVHHLDMDPSNCRWWNLAALCQKCHLHIQAKVVMERPWMFQHSEWFKPYVAGFYAYIWGEDDRKEVVLAHLERLLALGVQVL
ncbi:MAG: HNH endonuclease [Anaerolineales bacterium]|nr:HNH endonuclease [Anaerolineales bacterium]